MFSGVESEALMVALKSELAVSSGSACTIVAVLQSQVLKETNLSDDQSHSLVRFGLGRHTKDEDVKATIHLVFRESKCLHSISSLAIAG